MGEDRNETLGLRTLEDISGLILHSHDLQETLDNIVNLVAKRVGSDVCSIYLLEDDGETLRLKATKGLSRGSVGKIAMKTSEGLTGLAVEERGIIATDNAPLHPRYKYFRETREEKFLSFLGVPLLERKTPVGVLVVQTRESRVFTPAEISTISTIAYQISSIVINAKLLDSIHQKERERAFFASELEKMKAGEMKGRLHTEQEKKRKPSSLIGTPVSPGFARGKIYVFSRSQHDVIALEHAGSPQEERRRFQIALEKAKIQTLYMEKRVAEVMSKEDAAIFHSHLMFLEDRGFIAKIAASIDNGFSAGQAVRDVVDYYVSAFAKMEDPYLRERSADMEDIGRRLLDSLNGNSSTRKKLREKRIIVADDLLPSDMATMDHEKILGIVTEKGNAGSHAAIMAKSLGIPAVVGIDGLIRHISPRNEVIVDGTSGHLYINPDQRIKEEYERLERDFSLKQRELEGLRHLPAETADGFRVSLRANIGLLNDVKVAQANGAEGVGLYRTEFPYMTRKTFPNRTEQYNLYCKIVEGFPGFPVTIRTLDIGGDKGLSYFPFPKEDNPFMGWRSIRVSLDEVQIFREQLASILMASAHGRTAVMLPMISTIEEIRTVKGILQEVKEELILEKQPFDPNIPLGIMIELPAAVQIAHMLIKEVEFFSIGTNDLIQYTLAADRNNPKVKQYYDPCHPAILNSIKRVADVAHTAGKAVCICGEMAADPMMALLLMGIGITDFSLSAPYIPLIKQAIRRTTLTAAREIAEKTLQMESSTSIRQYLEKTRTALNL